MNQTAANFFHRNPLGFVRLRMRFVHGLVESRTRAAAQLLRSKRGYVDE